MSQLLVHVGDFTIDVEQIILCRRVRTARRLPCGGDPDHRNFDVASADEE